MFLCVLKTAVCVCVCFVHFLHLALCRYVSGRLLRALQESVCLESVCQGTKSSHSFEW